MRYLNTMSFVILYYQKIKTVKKKYLTPFLYYGNLHKVRKTILHLGEAMEQKIELAYLYDFYGELLNEHQRRIYEDFVFNDLSLGEIAQEEGISRQGVNDMVKRCSKKLMDYENKLHLVARFLAVKENVTQIHALAKQCKETNDTDILTDIENISNQILEEL